MSSFESARVVDILSGEGGREDRDVTREIWSETPCFRCDREVDLGSGNLLVELTPRGLALVAELTVCLVWTCVASSIFCGGTDGCEDTYVFDHLSCPSKDGFMRFHDTTGSE